MSSDRINNEQDATLVTEKNTLLSGARRIRRFTFRSKYPEFETVVARLNPPLEITRDMISVLNMVDETVIIHSRK